MNICSLLKKVTVFGNLVKFSHSIFVLPFALSMYVIVISDNEFKFSILTFLIIAMVSARTSAMAFNRYLDRDIDLKNERTKNREIPSGKISLTTVVVLFLISSLIFFLASYLLGVHCLILAPFVLFILCFYSYTKRFTEYAHIVLGLSLALAPGGVWYAITAKWSLLPIPLMLGVLFWVAGFDILYSCQDFEFDKKEKLHSIPARVGVANAFLISKVFHFLCVIFFTAFALVFNLGLAFYLGLSLFSLFLASQYFLVNPSNLQKIDAAFFNRNAYASVVFFISVLLDKLLG